MKAKKHFCNIFFLLMALTIIPSYGSAFTEPEMLDYTNYPLFVTTGSVKPNITIVLDNSQDMAEPAYGTFAGDERIVPESYHGGDSYMGIRRIIPLNSSDDAWMVPPHHPTPYEDTSTTLNLGNSNNPDERHGALAGIRFDNVEIPKDRTISNAWIEFMPAEDADTNFQIRIFGQKTDDPVTFTDATDLESRMDNMTTSVEWTPGRWEINNPDNATTPSLSNVVQELVDQPGWKSGNAMVFLVVGSENGTGKRVAHSWDSEGFSLDTNPAAKIKGGYAPVLHIEFETELPDRTRYYGLYSKGDWTNDDDTGVFEPIYYKYDSSEFIRCDSDKSGVCADGEKWHGNFLNWLTMRKIDVGMMALMGGFGSSRSTTNTHTARAQSDNSLVDFTFYKWHDSDKAQAPDNQAQVSPYDGKYLYKVENGTFSVFDETGALLESGIKIVIDVDPVLDDERLITASHDLDGDGVPDEEYVALNGIFENVGPKANWSFAQFPTSKDYDGGNIKKTFAEWSTINPSWLTGMQNFQMGNLPPTLAEMHWLLTSYYMQDESILGNEDGGRSYVPGNIYGDTYDPFKFTDEELECPNNFVLYISTGGSENDAALPPTKIDYDKDKVELTSINQSFDDIALYARTTDLRDDLEGEQNLITYVVYAFGNDDDDRALLMNAAKQGGFNEKGGREDFPDQQNEWDTNGDNIPDTYFEASGGEDVQKKILQAINAMLNRAASGTAASLLATRGEGEGTITQASFRPKVYTDDSEIQWVGSLQMLWVDSFGNIREDDGDKKLEIYEDPVVRFFLDTGTGDNMLSRYIPSYPDYPYPHDNATWTTEDIDELSPLWDAAEKLKDMNSTDRNILTNITNNSTIDFTILNAGSLTPYLGVEDDATWGTAAGLGATEDNRVNNIINFILGADVNYEGLASIRLKKDDDGKILKLGDIVNSTPVTVARPVENYGSIYNDTSYWTYYNKFVNRETVVYVGANDGMLHAFSAGTYNPAEQKFEGGTEIGKELWGYIPRSLLPHLKWLPQEEYTHVSYVDLDVRVTDAQIFDDNSTTHPGGWGSVLLGGLNLGGKDISTQNAGDFKPSVFAIDVTNPRKPILLWEKSFDPAQAFDPGLSGTGLEDLGLSTNSPGIIRVGGEWKLVYSSGPTDFDYDETTGALTLTSDQNACVYIVDMKTGEPERAYIVEGVTFNDSYFASPAAFDKELNYNVDSIFMGLTYNNNASGAIFKITVPQEENKFDDGSDLHTQEEKDDLYISDAGSWLNNFKLFALAPAPVTGPFNISIDLFDNVWLYGGTGRFMDQSDKTDAAQNYLFGIKDPFFNKKQYSGAYHDYTAEAAIAPISIYPADGQLFNADLYTINSDDADNAGADKVTGGDSLVTSWGLLLKKAREYDGWYRSLCNGSITDEGNCNEIDSDPSERIIKEPSILGGIVLFPTFSPSSDICGFGGEGRLWAVYYETGTAYKEYIFGNPNQDPIEDVIYLGSGISSSFGIHIGRQKGSTVFTQMSTGIVLDLNLNINTKTIQPTYWRNYVQ